MQKKKIRLNESKVVFRQEEVEFAGVIISQDGFQVNPQLINAIAEFPEPSNITELCSFHCTVNQLAPYDAKLAQKFEPIRHLLNVKSGPIKFTAEESEAFEKVKQYLVSPATLAFYRPWPTDQSVY